MYKVLLTGAIGSGKTTACKYLNKKGIDCIDSDAVFEKIIQKNEQIFYLLVARFGNAILILNSLINTPYLKDILKKQQIHNTWFQENIIPILDTEFIHLLNTGTSPYVVGHLPIGKSFPANTTTAKSIGSQFNYLALITTNKEIHLQRLMETRKYSYTKANIIADDAERASKQYLPFMNKIIPNNSTIHDFYAQIDALHTDIMNNVAR